MLTGSTPPEDFRFPFHLNGCERSLWSSGGFAALFRQSGNRIGDPVRMPFILYRAAARDHPFPIGSKRQARTGMQARDQLT